MTLSPNPKSLLKVIPAQSTTPGHLTKPDKTEDLRLAWIEQFLRASNLAKNSQKTYRIELKRFVTWTNKAWADVTPRDIARFKHYLMSECKTPKGKPLMPASVNQALAALKSFYSWFQSSGYMDLTAVLPTAAVKFEKLGKPLPKNLSDEQMEAISVVVEQGNNEIQVRDRALLAILTHGLRAGDISALNVGNYDGIRLRFFRDKDNSEALVPLRQAAREQIDIYLQWRRERREALTNESPLLLSHDFRTPGQRLGYQGIYYFVKERLGKAAGISNLTPHRFRHTYAANLVEMGIDTLLARSLTGHSSERVFQRYIEGKRLAAAQTAFYQAVGEEPSDSRV